MMTKDKTWRSRLRSSLLTLLAIFILFCGFVLLLQDSMIFHHVIDQSSREFLQDFAEYL